MTRFYVIWGLLALALAACGGGGRACTPGTTMSCVCVNGATGAQFCLADGTGFGACTCGIVGGDGGVVGCGDGMCAGGETCSSCPSDCGACSPVVGCGDGMCAGGETCSSCPSDCGACPPPACNPSADTCAGETICIGGRCEAAFGRNYAVSNIRVSVPTTDPRDGSAWDAFGGAPDIFIEVVVNGSVVARSPTRSDTFSATFAGPYNVTLVGGGSFGIVVWDEDVSSNDRMYDCGSTSVSGELLRRRDLSCSSGGFSVSFRIEPR